MCNLTMSKSKTYCWKTCISKSAEMSVCPKRYGYDFYFILSYVLRTVIITQSTDFSGLSSVFCE